MERPFLDSAGEAEEFEHQWCPRGVAATTTVWPFILPEPTDLQEAVSRAAKRLGDDEVGTRNRGVIGVTVESRDGMSWSATKARQEVEANVASDWEILCVWHTRSRRADDQVAADRPPDALEQLVSLIGNKRAVLRAARVSKLVPELARPWAMWFVIALILMAVGAGTWLLTDFASKPGEGLPLALPAIGLAALLGAVAAWMTQEWLSQLTPLIGSKSYVKLASTLNSEWRTDAVEQAFQDALLESLEPDRRRAVIIENFGELSPRAKKLVEAYLRRTDNHRHRELWVLFARGRRVGHRKADAPDLITLLNTDKLNRWFCHQRILSPPEREELLQKREQHPPRREDPRLRQESVAHLVGKAPTDKQGNLVELERDLANLEKIAARRAFALLALATVAPDPVPIGAADFPAIVRDSSAGNAQRRQLLREWFPEGSRGTTTIEDAVNTVASKLSGLLEEPPNATVKSHLRVVQVYADALRARDVWEPRYQLPPQDRGHAFWALHTHSELIDRNRWSAPIAEQLVAHLRAIREPAQLRNQRKLANRLFDVALDAAEAALALCIGGLTSYADPAGAADWESGPGLLEQARLLLAVDRGTPDRQRSYRLLTSAWTTYMLTGEPALIDMIASLTADLGSAQAPTTSEPLLELYRELVPRFEGEPPRPSPTVGPAQAAVLDHARVRGAWLAEILRPLIQDEKAKWLTFATEVVPTELVAVLDRAIGRLHEGRTDATAALDLLTLTYALHCDALAKWRGSGTTADLTDRLEAVKTLTAKRLLERKHSGARTHFILDGLLRQLDATTRACSAAVDASKTPERLAYLRTVLGELGDLHVMWHNLEFHELADFAAFSRNTLGVLAGRHLHDGPQGEQVADYLIGIGVTGSGDVHRMEAELLVGAARVPRSETTAAVPLVQAANLAIGSSLGTKLTTELCLLILSHSQNMADKRQTERLTAYLLNPAPGHPGPFEVPDTEMRWAAATLLGGVTSPSSPIYAELRKAILQRRDLITCPWSRDYLDQHHEWFIALHGGSSMNPAVLSDLLNRWRERVWKGGPQEATGSGDSQPSDYQYWTRSYYAFVLSYVWDGADHPGSSIAQDAARLLASVDERMPNTGSVYLAHKVATRHELGRATQVKKPAQSSTINYGRASSTTRTLAITVKNGTRTPIHTPLSDTGHFERAVNIQRNGIEAAETHLRADTNQAVYEQLARHDPSRRSDYTEKAQFWRAEDERQKQELLIHDGTGGRAFEVFWHHFNRVPELPLDCDRDELIVRLDQAGAALWAATMQVPEPLIFDGNGQATMVSGDFLCVGHHLVHVLGDDAPGQETMNQVAHSNIDGLYSILIEKTPISEYLKEIYRKQRRRFEET